MRRKIAFLTIICLLTAGAGLWPQEAPEPPRLAVARFTPNISGERINADVVTVRNLVESQMVGTRKYQIVTRDEIDKLLENQNIQMSSISSAENIKKLQLQNISYIVTGSVNAMGSDYAITVNVLDVATGQFSHSADGFMGSDSRDLYAGISDLMSRFNAGMSSTGEGTIVQGTVRNTTADTGIAIEVSAKLGGALYFQDEEIATLWDNDTYTIPIERPGTYAVKMVFGNETTIPKMITITSRGTVKVAFSLLVVGEQGPGGGIIFYDKGSFADSWRYLEATPVSAEFNSAWGAYGQNVSGTTVAVGSGKQNTQIIVSSLGRLGESGKVIQLCDNLDFGGFNDWFLPSKDELALMYNNLKLKGLGDFGDKWYWSSSQYNPNGVWAQHFGDGSQDDNYKYGASAVRVVRAF